VLATRQLCTTNVHRSSS